MAPTADSEPMFELAPCGLVLMSADYAILSANRYFYDLTGRGPDAIAARLKFPELLSAAGRIFTMTRLQQELALKCTVEELVLDIVRPDGRREPVMLNAAQETTADGHPGRIRLALWRAAAKRAYEAEVPKAREEAQAAARVKGDFLANISHEVRTPLNGVVGAAAMLAARPLAEAERELVEMIQGSADLAVRLLSDILDLSRVQAGSLTLDAQPFELAATLAGVLELARMQAVEKGLAFEAKVAIPDGVRFVGDAVRLRQVLAALLSNAVKFTGAGGVRVEVRRGADGAVLMCVEDTGPGFDPADAERLFQPFEQAETGISRSAGGAGVGLAICRGLADLMGGSVTLQTEPGVGSRFEVHLPLESAPDSTWREAEPAAAGDERPLRILLVEDNPTNRRVVELILAGADVELATAENGALGVEAWRDGGFDLVLMDLQMPVMDGLTAIREIRRLEREAGRPRTRIVVLSANAMAHHRQEALEAGGDLHLAKPITPQALFGGIEAALTLAA